MPKSPTKVISDKEMPFHTLTASRPAKLAEASRAAKPHGSVMAKLMRPADEAQALSVRERVLLLCVASNTNWLHAGVPGETVTAMIVKGLITPDGEDLALTDRGRAVLRAMLPEL